jgi:2-(1,2-epoxy-1,2-dihydrophenyl)acetyl-CoA isomerase
MTAMVYQHLVYTVSDGVAKIVLNRPEVLNAFNEKMGEEFADSLKAAEEDSSVRVVVVTGAGRGFCAGEDLGALLEAKNRGKVDLGDSLRRKYNPVIMRMVDMPKPLIASVNGVAAGAGFSIALACDLRVASEKATFIQAFTRIGLAPDSGSSFFLPRLIGYSRAAEAMLTAQPIDAVTAERLGIVNKLVKHEELEVKTGQLASQLAAGPTQAYSLVKKALMFGLTHTLSESLEYEARAQTVASNTEDHLEGLKAFVEKRSPTFRGK